MKKQYKSSILKNNKFKKKNNNNNGVPLKGYVAYLFSDFAPEIKKSIVGISSD